MLMWQIMKKLTKSAFTLIELLCVCLIIGVLSGLILTSVYKVLARSKRLVCAGQLRQIWLGAYALADENFPPFETVALVFPERSLRCPLDVPPMKYAHWKSNVNELSLNICNDRKPFHKGYNRVSANGVVRFVPIMTNLFEKP